MKYPRSPIAINASGELAILVVDDDEQIREILADMLAMDGHETVTCADGPSALQALDHRSFDLMITDLGMPGMSGWSFRGPSTSNSRNCR